MCAKRASLELYILCCDRPDFAREAIQSALRQSTDRFLIVISDNSTGSSIEQLARSEFPGLTYRRRSPHMRVLEHLNQCLNEASAQYVCLFHDDDVLDPAFVEQILDCAARFPAAAAIGVNAWLVEEGRPAKLSFGTLGNTHSIHGPRQLAAYYYSRHQLGIAPFPSYVYSTARMGDLRFDEAAGKFSDVAWLLRVAERGEIIWLSEPLMTYRLHSSNDGRKESIGDRLKLFAFFKRNLALLGPGLVGDYRFFLYKKVLELHRRQVLKVSASKRRTLRTYVARYRVTRFCRLDHHRALLRKAAIRLVQHFRSPVLKNPPGPA